MLQAQPLIDKPIEDHDYYLKACRRGFGDFSMSKVLVSAGSDYTYCDDNDDNNILLALHQDSRASTKGTTQVRLGKP